MKNDNFEPHLKITLVILLLALMGLNCILAWVPPVSRDALTHHLVVPKLYLDHGSIYEIPSIVFSYYPMNLDLLYMIPLYFGNDIVPKFIHFIFALLNAWLIYSYLRKRLDTGWALLGALSFLSLPIIVKLSITVYVDLGLIFFSTASIMSLLRWIESRYQVKFLILAGACCGLALGTKYNGLIILFILTLFVPLIFMIQNKKTVIEKKPSNKTASIKFQLKALVSGIVFFLVALMVFSPWMIRNVVWKGNPIYPLYDNLINPPKFDLSNTLNDGKILESAADLQQNSAKRSTRWGPLAVRKIIYGEAWWEIALVPVRIFFQGQDDNPQYFDGRLNPFLFFLPFFAFVQLKNNSMALRTEKKIFIFFAILFLLFVFSQADMRIRWVAPILPPLVILSILGLHQLTTMITNRWSSPDRAGRIGVSITLVVAAIMLFLNASYIMKLFDYVKPFSYISGRVSRDTYIAGYRPEYSLYQYASRHLPTNAKILGFFLGNRLYYSTRELTLDPSIFKNIIKEAESVEAAFTGLQTRGFTHLLIRFDLFNRWTDRQFNDRSKEMLKKFFNNHTRHLLSNDGYGLFELNGHQ